MDTDRIEAAARECWDSTDAVSFYGCDESCVSAIAALVRREVEREREACEKLCDDALERERGGLNAGGYIEACMELAAAIRARGGKEPQ